MLLLSLIDKKANYLYMRINYREEFKIWLIYFLTIFVSIYIHEIGHCIPAWVNGYTAIPTPVKQYIFETIPPGLNELISLWGIAGTVLVSLLTFINYLFKPNRINSSVLAGGIATPGMYTLRFILIGRGHDATEFQEVQSALGLSYEGHSLDWFFITLILIVTIIWFIKSKSTSRILIRLLIGFVLTVIFLVALQTLNNSIFDPIFQSKTF